ncbi:ThiF family adenylyltransferase, partial [Candidatus Parcubacteria bacterium]
MKPDYTLSLSKKHHDILRNHLFPGDGCEAIAIALCGRRRGTRRHKLLVREVHPIPYKNCSERTPERLTWSTELLAPLLKKANQKGWSVLKIHSHLEQTSFFSKLDDTADRDLFSSVYGWTEDTLPHASAIMLPDGSMIGRVIAASGEFIPLTAIHLVGDDLNFWQHSTKQTNIPEFGTRVAQTFGKGTYGLLSKLRVAVIGCSGTGSLVIEQLARNGVGELLLVDPDIVEEKNLNRIPNTTKKDATNETAKVTVLSKNIEKIGLGTRVEALQLNLMDPKAIFAVADCDIVFGCLDSIEGRHILNRLAIFYLIPYIDLGVKLVADGKGNVDEVCGSVHYLQPGGSSLLSRGLYTDEELRAESLRRTDPEGYEARRKEGYIQNANEEKPAVISVNMMVAALAVNELLARIHPFRVKPNGEYAIQRFSL